MSNVGDADRLHDDAILIDDVCPLLADRRYTEWYREGGFTAVAPTVAIYENAWQTVKALGAWHAWVARNPSCVVVRSAADIEAAKRDGRLGLILHFQNSDPVENDLDLVNAYKELGVGVIQLCYNVQNRVGSGATERDDRGLSTFGEAFVARCNEARVVIDCSHTGRQTTLDAIAASRQPVIFSHANPKGAFDCARNIDDVQIRAIADKGGVIGAVGFGPFLGTDPRPTLDRYIDHIAYLVRVAGAEHVCLGLDYFRYQHPVASDEEARAMYDAAIASGKWSAGTYPPPPYHYPEGIETPRTMRTLTRGLVARGFDETTIRRLYGLNLLRVYRDVWGA
jgi:membrane dipeptidase